MITFYTGAMGSGKTEHLIRFSDELKKNPHFGSESVLILTSSIDNRFGKGIVKSRNGQEREAIAVNEDNFAEVILSHPDARIAFIDEVQFFTSKMIHQMIDLSDELNINFYCYGLRTDFRGQFFDASVLLLAIADRIETIESKCSTDKCFNRSVFNMRVINGQPVFEGEQIQIGGDESYRPVCRECYFREYHNWLSGGGRYGEQRRVSL